MSYDLRLGDCLEPLAGMATLADGSVDHLIADAPYSDRVHVGFGAEQRTDLAKARGDIGFTAITQEQIDAIASETARTVKRWALMFCDDRTFGLWASAFERAGLRFFCAGIWVKSDAMPRMAGDGPAYGVEHICIAHAKGRGRTRWAAGGRSAVWTGSIKDPGASRAHPTQKPEWLMSALVRDFTDPGETVLDPFAGSGTTGVACIRMGRNFIGWEKDPTFHAAALRRLAGTVEQPELCLGKPPKQKQSAIEFPTPEAT